MAKRVIWATVFALAAAMLQSTLLSRLAVYRAVPDIVLGIIVYMAYTHGAMTGQITGFCSGLILDFLSAAPLGLHALMGTMIGAGLGLMKGSFFLDPLFLPTALCAGATLLKALLLAGLHLLFTRGVPAYILEEPTFWVELLENSLSAPLLFAFLKLFKNLLVDQRKTP
ncbi:MAG: rod shape-determining protein MreD [Spirochaetaceae bacterium]|jgi:rod shape-determining protein MreD|nr:rod shape-determining protein MreD [Spirochaetaceae bacterium]